MTWACGYGCPALALLALCTARKLSEGGWTRFICTRLGAARITLMWLQLRAEQILAGGCVPPLYVWVGDCGKTVLFAAIPTHLVVIPQPTSMPVWQPEKCFFSCDTALGPDLGSRRCPSPSLWVSQEVFLLMMRWRAVGLWNAAHIPVAVAFQEGASGSALQVQVLLARRFFPVDVPVGVALGGHHMRA